MVKSVLSAARTATSLIGYISLACLWKLGYDPKLIYFSFALLAGMDTVSFARMCTSASTPVRSLTSPAERLQL